MQYRFKFHDIINGAGTNIEQHHTTEPTLAVHIRMPSITMY